MDQGEGSAAASALDAALALHRANRFHEARGLYHGLLAASPEDPNLLGLLGVLALQNGEVGDAETLLRRALAVPDPEPCVQLRNVNNLFTLLHGQVREAAAQALAATEVPDWPPGRVPDDRERRTILSLVEALHRYGHPERALGLLESAMPVLADDAEALNLAGRLRLACRGAEAALPALLRACELDPGNWLPLAALGVAHDRLGDGAAAAAAAERCLRLAPVHVAPRQHGQTATILVLNGTPSRIQNADAGLHGLHFATNYIGQASLAMAGEFRFASVIADLPGPLPDLPAADLAFNNLAGGEAMSLPGQLTRATALVDRIGRPVINHPEGVYRMTRQKAADLLRDIPGLRVPRIARYARDLARLDEIDADIAAQLGYPAIIRHVAADESSNSLLSDRKTAILVQDAAALRSFLEQVAWPQFYAIEYVALRKADGNFRRLRAAFFPDEIILIACGYYSEWMVAGWRTNKPGHDFYSAFPHRVADMQRTLRDPEAVLGSQFMPVLEAIRERVPLEVFGMDFDLDDDGNVVLFEAQATMILLMPRGNVPDHLQLPPELDDRVNAAFRRLVRRKIAEAG